MSLSSDIILSNVNNFLNNKCGLVDNAPFSAYISINETKESEFPIVYDKEYNINCIFNSKNLFDNIIKENNNKKFNIKQSNFDLLFYKTNNNTPSIGVLIVLIINEIECEEVQDNKRNNDTTNINLSNEVNESIKKFIYSYITEKELSNDFPHWSIDSSSFTSKQIPHSNYSIENLLLGYNSIARKIRLLNFSLEKLNGNAVEQYVQYVENVISPVEIMPCKIDNKELKENESKEKEDKLYKKIFLNTLIIHNKGEYLADLRKKYIAVMPKDLKNLLEKYKYFRFNKKMFISYKEKKEKKQTSKIPNIIENNIKIGENDIKIDE